MASEAMSISCHMTSRQRVDGPVDQSRAIVGGDDMNARRQPRLQFLDLLLDPLGDSQRILAVTHQHGAARHFVAVLFVNAAAELRAQLHRGHVLDDRSVCRRPP